jgi:hypothetical protein
MITSRVSTDASYVQPPARVLFSGFITASIAAYLLLSAILAIFFPAFPILIHLLVIAALYAAWRWPGRLIAIILLLAPFLPLPILALKAAKIEWAVVFSSLKELGMLIAVAVMAWRVRLRLGFLDFVILTLIGWALLVSVMFPNPSTLIGLKDDFAFVISFYAGRLILLNKKWIKSGLWVAAVVATLGLIEFFWVGPVPRMLLTGLSDPAELANSYTATGFAGFRAASTLGGPLEFGAFCTITLLCFVTFYRELPRKYFIPATLLMGGLVASITRMAWLAFTVCLLVIAIRTGQKRRLLIMAGIGATAALLLIVPYLGLEDFIAATQQRADPSAEGHTADLVERYSFVLSHPLGMGAGMVGPRALEREPKAQHVESAYLQIGMGYGWAGILLFSTFMVNVLVTLWKDKSDFGVAAFLVALAMSIMYFFSPIHESFEVNSWAWVLIGFGVQNSLSKAEMR